MAFQKKVGTAITVVGLPLSVSLGVVSTVSTCAGACLLLTSKKYKRKLIRCYELLDKITSSLATFEVLIPRSASSPGYEYKASKTSNLLRFFEFSE